MSEGDGSARSDLRTGSRARRRRRIWRAIPGTPRCKLCTSPFGPPGGPLMRLIGKGRWQGNSSYCAGCFKTLYRERAGAEIECTLLFADVRGSTSLAESMRPAEFRALLDRFYAVGVAVLIRHEAVVDKFVGDEVIGIFVPALAGAEHAEQAVDAARELLRATGHGEGAPWMPIGIGVNTGEAFVGVVGTDEHIEFTALGDAVNVAARLASAAGVGELLVTEETARAAGLASATSARERRHLELRGRSQAADVIVLDAGA